MPDDTRDKCDEVWRAWCARQVPKNRLTGGSYSLDVLGVYNIYIYDKYIVVSSIHSLSYTYLYIFNMEHVEGLQGNNMKEFGMSRQCFTSRFRHLSLILASDWPLISFSFAALSFFNFAIFAFQRFSSRETVCSLSQNPQKTV